MIKKYRAYFAADRLYDKVLKEERAAQNDKIRLAYAEYEEAKARADAERAKLQAGSY